MKTVRAVMERWWSRARWNRVWTLRCRRWDILIFMASLYLVRHGNASSTWEPGDFDPGLSELGRAQAEARAEQLADKGPLALLSSPLRRARDTAAALERRWKTVATIDPRIGEIQAA